MKYFAHSRLNGSTTEYQELADHLKAVGLIAERFVQKFGFDDVGQILGLLHDAGKYSSLFQERIRGANIKVDHATAGAQIANEKFTSLGKMLSYTLAGHHGGMPDGLKEAYGDSSLNARLTKKTEDYSAFYNEITIPGIRAFKKLSVTKFPGFSIAFLTRMLYSALVDADYLDTEMYISKAKGIHRFNWPTLHNCNENYKFYMENLNKISKVTYINKIRSEINKSCLEAAHNEKGIFSLTVPTGGGKTLASLGFALEHAIHRGMDRIVYAIPYTSIIEQNAEVFRKVVGPEAILEHHSNIDYTKYEETEREKLKLSSENWNAPIVVSTNVQLFESLFSNKPSKCRKLHNLANSVIILDEVQNIPDRYLKPCLMALQCLVKDYGATVLLCTATQPALRFAWPDPQQEVIEIIDNPSDLFSVLERVEINKPQILTNDTLAGQLLEHKQVLCIVNTKKRARLLFDAVKNKSNAYHLSTYMCPEHRSVTLTAIKTDLAESRHCIVISTQLIEAGVDIDFPVVYRDLAGIDSIAQAAGRCNREGKLDKGIVNIVRPEDPLPIGEFQRHAELGEAICRHFNDILAPDAVMEYFVRRYRDRGAKGLDTKEIIDSFNDGANSLDFPFNFIANKFNFIESVTESIVVPYDDKCRKHIEESYTGHGAPIDMTVFQRYIVNLYPNEIAELRSRGYLNDNILPCPVLDVSENDFSNVYSMESGIKVNSEMETLLC